MNEGEWVLVQHENPQKFESKWFGLYQIAQKMTLATCRLQNPKGRELQALVHGNRLLKAYINSEESLPKLWASPVAKDVLQRNTSQKLYTSSRLRIAMELSGERTHQAANHLQHQNGAKLRSRNLQNQTSGRRHQWHPRNSLLEGSNLIVGTVDDRTVYQSANWYSDMRGTASCWWV
jgi:hypothetical protein